MGYIKAGDILPQKLIDEIQSYVDGQCIYIPRRADRRRAWGEVSRSRALLALRNREIYQAHLCGVSTDCLAQRYYLSPKSIQKIISRCRREAREP